MYYITTINKTMKILHINNLSKNVYSIGLVKEVRRHPEAKTSR